MCTISKINKHLKSHDNDREYPIVTMALFLLVIKEGFNVFQFSFIWREE